MLVRFLASASQTLHGQLQVSVCWSPRRRRGVRFSLPMTLLTASRHALQRAAACSWPPSREMPGSWGDAALRRLCTVSWHCSLHLLGSETEWKRACSLFVFACGPCTASTTDPIPRPPYTDDLNSVVCPERLRLRVRFGSARASPEGNALSKRSGNTRATCTTPEFDENGSVNNMFCFLLSNCFQI